MTRQPFFTRTALIFGLLATAFFSFAASTPQTFGTVVPIAGHLSDIALDEARGLVYTANFTTNRVEVISMDTGALQKYIELGNPEPSSSAAPQPSSLAISPDGRYLVVGHYTPPQPVAGTASTARLTIVDLNSPAPQSLRQLDLQGGSVLAVAFGNGSKALVVSADKVSLVDPSTGIPEVLSPTSPSGAVSLPVPWATFPPQIMKASSGVSGDGNVVYTLVEADKSNYIFRYDVVAAQVTLLPSLTSSPTLGPVVMSVDQTGRTFMAGWTLTNAGLVDLAELPYPSGSLNVGGHAFDWSHQLIYAQVPVGAGGQPVLHVLDSDNLTVRQIFRLRENLAGKALISSARNKMYAISDSGVTIFPIDTLLPASSATSSGIRRVKALQEDLLFQASGCGQGSITQFLDIVDPSGGATDFSLAADNPGVKLLPSSGTTPARVQVVVDPTAFQSNKGTATVHVQITSPQAVNIPMPIRVLINTRDPRQQGTLFDVPGTLVDVLADPDPATNRFFVLRQDQNQVLVFDGTSFQQIGSPLRTGNTPMQMTVFVDKDGQRYLLVTNDHSQLVNIYDLKTLAPVGNNAIVLRGSYARSIVALKDRILATIRCVGSDGPSGLGCGPDIIFSTAGGIGKVAYIDFQARRDPQAAAGNQGLVFGLPGINVTGIYQDVVDINSALAASPSQDRVFMTMPGGTVALYDYEEASFIASRKDGIPLSGGYGALSDNRFVAGNHVFNEAMVRIGDLDSMGGVSSGVTAVDGNGIFSTSPDPGAGGVLQRFSLDQFNSLSNVTTAETPVLNITTVPQFQIGRTLLPFTRNLAPLTNKQSIVQLSASGITVLPWAFDAALQPPVINAVTNAADFTPPVAPGGLISIWGSGLSSGTTAASALPLPTGLGGVCLYANSVPLSLLFVSPTQINAQLPFDAPANASVVISTSGGQSSPFNFAVQPTAPALFRTANGTPTIIRTVDNKLITDQTPIHLNEILIIYLTGMGAVAPPVKAGEPSPSNPLSKTIVQPVITIGGSPLFTLFSGLAPGFPGLYQINAQVPFHHIPTGSSIPFTITQGSASTTVKLRVEE